MKKSSMSDIKGIVPPIITPIDDIENVDEKSLRRLVNRCVEIGLHGIFVAGSCGETMSITPEQRRRAIKIVLDEVNGRVPVFCGVIDLGTKRVIENIKALEQMGGKIAIVTPPFYIKNSSQGEIIRHYEKIARSTSVSIIVYNAPGNTQVNIMPETMLKLSEIDNVIGLKDSSGSWDQFQKYIFLLKGKQMKIFQGLPELGAASILLGADGLTPIYSIILPNLYLGLYQAAVDRNVDLAFDIQKVISKFYNVNKYAVSPVSIQKFIISLLGLSGKRATAPCEPLSEQEEKVIRNFVERYMELDCKLKSYKDFKAFREDFHNL